MINYKEELNKEQLKVIEHGDGPCLVLAGAGSGKTRTITYRVAHLLDKGIQPDEILLLTFTNKAAKEMISRVQNLTKEKTRLRWSGTFHHLAYMILIQYAPLLGYEPNFTILDSEDSRSLIKLSMSQEGIDNKQKRFPSPKVLQSIISYARNAERTIEDVLDEQHPKWLDFADQIARIAEDYAKRKRQANAMDFDDLLVNLYLLLLKSENSRNKFAKKFKYVMVDEYQDTNKVQASIVNLLSSVHKNILVVGDDAQSIYSFRAADIQNILAFEKKYPNAKIFKLETNYRSTPEILNLANDVIAQNKMQYEKNLRAFREEFTRPELHAFADQSEEAEFIAERILELREEGVPLSRVAVLFRAAFHSQALEVELTKRDIPYDFRGGVRFFERKHIKDVLSFLRVFANPDDTVAWSRVITMQVGIGAVTAQKIISKIKQNILEKKQMFDEVGSSVGARAQVGWNDFLQIWEKMEKVPPTPAGLILAILESKYRDYLELEYENYRDRIADIEQLAVFADKKTNSEEEPEKILTRFLAEASMQESYTAAMTHEGEYDDEELVLSTIHQAKGLEWDAVFVISMSAGKFPSERSMREQNGIEEERRLFYVAITRAKRFLYLTYPLTAGFASILQGPSMFISEIEDELIYRRDFIDSSDTLVFTDPSDDVDDIVYEPDPDAEPFVSRNPKRQFLKSIDEL